MIRRTRLPFRKVFLGAVYTLSLLVWVALVFDTVGLARQASEPVIIPTSAPLVVPTARPPRVVPPKPAEVLRNIAPAAEQQVSNFHPKTGRYIAAWLPDSFDSVNRQSFEANADILDEVSPFWYTADTRGRLQHGSDARDKTLIELAHSKNVLVIPTVHNIVCGECPDPVPTILRSPERRSQHVRNIVDEVIAHNYDGFDIDYEAIDSGLRDEFSAFITELGAALHAQGKLLTIAVHAKTEDYGGLGGFQDWAVIGQAVDRLRIMTYDYHWRGSSRPGPVAPIYWVRAVADYAKTVVDPAKVVIGVPFYGYNWPTNGGPAIAQTWDMINELRQAYNLDVNLKESDENGPVQENWMTYSTRQDGRREVWFATGRGLEAKLGLVQDLDLAGVAIWRLGGEDPKNWDVIRAKLVQDPFESQRMLNGALPDH
jgi:spore germination protein YaaH